MCQSIVLCTASRTPAKTSLYLLLQLAPLVHRRKCYLQCYHDLTILYEKFLSFFV